MRVAELMTSEIAECSPGESLRAAAKRMVDHGCGCLPVTVCDGTQKRLVGIITDRDLACRAVAEGLDPERTEVGRCMSFPVQTIPHDADLGDCIDRFTTVGVRRLVVVDGQNRCLGIISRTDLRRHVVDSATCCGAAGDQPMTAPLVPVDSTAPSRAQAAPHGMAAVSDSPPGRPANDPARGNLEPSL